VGGAVEDAAAGQVTNREEEEREEYDDRLCVFNGFQCGLLLEKLIATQALNAPHLLRNLEIFRRVHRNWPYHEPD
jgi:hypothetical protein